MPTLRIDGREVTIDKGRTIIQACEQLGIEVPRYCYHPGLKVVGSCRMCLVDVEKLPKLQIACNTPAADDMVVWTKNDKVKEARRAVLEFLLLNHPLDCPVCDRAGECELQNYYMKYGQHDSRFRENKLKKKKAFPIGPHVILDQERCVLCSRCVRFTEEIPKTRELGIFNRGTWSLVDVYPGRQLDNNYSGNVVDICPVGALLDRDFRYQVSVWYLKESMSVCPGCSTGCNIRVHYNLDRAYKTPGRRVLRLKPRFNDHVNRYWMCDEGRYNYKWIDLNRIESPMVHESDGMKKSDWVTVVGGIAEQLKSSIESHGKDSVAVILSPQMTNEELFLARKIFYDFLGITTMPYSLPLRPGDKEDSILLRRDKNPNTRGADLIFPEWQGKPVSSVLDQAKNGKIRCLYIFHTNLLDYFGLQKTQEALDQVDTVIYHGTNQSEFLSHCTFVVSAATYAEKEGTFTNYQGRVQRIFAGIPPLKNSRPTLDILRDLAVTLGMKVPSISASDIFQDLGSTVPAFHGMNYGNIGLSGKLIQETQQTQQPQQTQETQPTQQTQ